MATLAEIMAGVEEKPEEELIRKKTSGSSLDEILAGITPKKSSSASAYKAKKGSTLAEIMKGLDSSEDYSALRSGAVEFVEGAVGAGDELDAIIRRVSGDADTWDEAITESRADLERFGNENPMASRMLYGSGLVSGFWIPGAGMAKIAQAGTKLQRAAKVGALGAAEGSVYGFLAGEGEGRVDSALLGAGVGGVLGAASGAFLTKGAPVSQKKGKDAGTHIGGDNGSQTTFGELHSNTPSPNTVNSRSASMQEKLNKEIEIGPAGASKKRKVSDWWESKLLGMQEYADKFVGERFSKLAVDAENQTRVHHQAITETYDTTFKAVHDLLAGNEQLKQIALQINPKIIKNRKTWADLKKAAGKDAHLIEDLETQVRLLQANDIIKYGPDDYIPSLTMPGLESASGKAGVGTTGEYQGPVLAVKEMAEDIASARALMDRFKIDPKNIKVPKKWDRKGRVDLVIDAIQAQMEKDGAGAAAANGASALRTWFIASKQGGHALGAVMRRVTSTALLANPNNAVLNMAEWTLGPMYQNGFRATIEALPEGIVSAFRKNHMIKNKNWMSKKDIGSDSDFMGELAQSGKEAIGETADMVAFMLPAKYANKLDEASKTLYKYSGVTKSNTVGYEMQMNSALKLGKRLAKKGDGKSLDKLRRHDGMKGLTESEFQSSVAALKKGDYSDPWVKLYAGASLNKIQPHSAATMPKWFHDNPNGRIFYSMLSYMNRQMNVIRSDVGLNMWKAQKLGLNSKEGSAAMKEAMKSSAKYAAIFGVAAGIWDDFRMTLDQSKDERTLAKLMTPDGVAETTLNQLISNASSGVVNKRAEEFGGKPFEPIPAPISAAFSMGTSLYKTGENLLTDENDPFNPLLKATQTYVPGFSNIDRIVRMGTGKRLLTDD